LPACYAELAPFRFKNFDTIDLARSDLCLIEHQFLNVRRYTLVVFRVGGRDAELLAPEFRPMDSGAVADQEPYTARRSTGRDRVLAAPKL
jgi:hypothetical protein